MFLRLNVVIYIFFTHEICPSVVKICLQQNVSYFNLNSTTWLVDVEEMVGYCNYVSFLKQSMLIHAIIYEVEISLFNIFCSYTHGTLVMH